MKIENMLKNYRSDKSKLKLLEIEESEILFEMGCLEEQTTFLGCQKLSDMPRSVTNKLVSAVENIAMQREKDQGNKAQMLFRLAEISGEKFELRCEIDRVEALIDSLGEEERFITELYYMEGHTKPEYIAYKHNEKFKDGIKDNSTIWRKKERAIRKLETLLKCS